MRRLSALTTALLVLGPLSSTTGAQASETDDQSRIDRITTPTLSWGACGDGVPTAFECASVEVPTDYDEPNGPTTTIALTRLPASDPDLRQGSLFLNFGGPGGPGVPSLQATAELVVAPSVRERYDLVGFDPRGVGLSDPALCFESAAAEAETLSGLVAFPVDRSEAKPFIRANATLSAACAARAGDRIRHASTANVARDLELLRRAVGDEQLTYLGYSYGTYLGATYARLFPDRVGRFVLDGTVDPDAFSGADRDPRSVGARLGQGPAADAVFGQFLEQCEAAGEGCSLNALGTPADVVDTLLARLRDEPVTIDVEGEPVELTYATTIASVFTQLYSPDAWAGLADFLVLLDQGGGTPPPALLRRLDRAEDAYTSVGSSLATLCVDSRSVLPPAAYPALADREARSAPLFGAFRAWVGVQCAQMGLQDEDAYRGPWTQTTDATVVVIGTRHDPATPYSSTRPFADRFPDARTVTVEGYGHTTLGVSACSDALVAEYLVEGAAPADGATCDQDRAPFSAPTTLQETPPQVDVPGPLPVPAA